MKQFLGKSQDLVIQGKVDGTRIILYQVAMASGMRYTNGLIELRGRGMDLELSRERQTVRMACKQYELPPKKD